MNLSFYMVLKAGGKAVKDHPVVDELIRLRKVMEKMRPLERKLKYQIDKLLKAPSAGAVHGAADPLKMRANLADLAASDSDEADGSSTGGTSGTNGKRANLADLADTEDESEDEGARGDDLEVTPQTLASGVYRAPKQREVNYDGAATPESRRRAEAARARQRAAKSALMSYIRDEYGDAPAEERNIGDGIYETADGADAEDRARRAYEEDRFVRLAETRAQRQRERNPRLVDELGNLGRLADLAALRNGGRGGGSDDEDGDEGGADRGASGGRTGRPRTLSEAMRGISRDALEAGRARARWLGEPAAGGAGAGGSGSGRTGASAAGVGEDEDEDIDSDTAYGPEGGDDEGDADTVPRARGKKGRKGAGAGAGAEVVVGRGAAKRAAREQRQAEREAFRGKGRRRYNEDGTRDRRPKKKPHF